MHSIALEIEAVWQIDEKVEECLCDRYGLDDEKNWMFRGFEAIDGNREDAV